MGIVTIGMFSRNLMGLEGSIYLMLSHGLVSSGLFLCIGVLYDRYGTRAISYYGGVVNFMPLFSTFFLIFTFANIGFPGTSAFIGEFIILMGAYSFHSLVCVFASTGVILSAAYSVWLYNRVIFGPVNSHMKKFMDLNRRETYYLGLLVFLVLLFGVLPNYILDGLSYSTSVLNRDLVWSSTWVRGASDLTYLFVIIFGIPTNIIYSDIPTTT
jgi:NADH-quinone oxidoreductase subunit M